MHLESKLPDIGMTIFATMSKMAADHGAINLSQGFPDFDVYPELIELVEKYMQEGHNQYAPMQGVLALRGMISKKVERLYHRRYDPDREITVTSGATEALFAAISAVVRTGDEVIVLEPAYDSYVPVIRLNGGTPVFLKLKYPDYHIDWDEVADAITDKTRLIILNSPHNPTGAVLGETDIRALTDIVSGSNLFILSDEVYEHIIFDGVRHKSMSMYPELAERAFVVSSFGKTYHATGWKIGYCLAPEKLSREFQRIHQYVTFSSITPVQLALAEIMKESKLYLDLPEFYQGKRDLFLDMIKTSRFKPLPCSGTYFMMLDYSEIADESDIRFAGKLTADYGVAAIPPSVFYSDGQDNKVLRFCFAKRDETLGQAAEVLCGI